MRRVRIVNRCSKFYTGRRVPKLLAGKVARVLGAGWPGSVNPAAWVRTAVHQDHRDQQDHQDRQARAWR